LFGDISQAAFADTHFSSVLPYRLAAARQLECDELLLVVLFKGRGQLVDDVGLGGRQGLDVCRVGASMDALSAIFE
jgi:hypothetical protein